MLFVSARCFPCALLRSFRRYFQKEASTLKVCIDIQAAIAQRAGVGRYTKSLVEHLGPLAGPDQLTLFYFDFKRRGVPFHVPNASERAVTWCPGRIVQKAWKTIDWPAFDWFAGSADVYHFPNFIIPPLRRGRTVVTIHDVSFMRFPDAAEPKNLQYLNGQIRKTIERADLILTDSQFSADEMTELLNVAPDRVKAVHLGLTPNMGASDSDAVEAMRGALKLDAPYLLFVGTLEPRKNIPFLIECFEQMESFDGDLVIAGMRGWKVEPILKRMDASRERARIRYLEYVDEQWLPALYAGAKLFMFPSLYEGFGFPPLEAMRCGTPVLSSRAGSLPEVLGDAAAYVDSYDAEEWAGAATSLLADSGQRAKRVETGQAQAARYQWEETARETWGLYREVAS